MTEAAVVCPTSLASSRAHLGIDGFAAIQGAVSSQDLRKIEKLLKEAPDTPAARRREGVVYAIRDILQLVPQVRDVVATWRPHLSVRR